jgi:hypothetical protein
MGMRWTSLIQVEIVLADHEVAVDVPNYHHWNKDECHAEGPFEALSLLSFIVGLHLHYYICEDHETIEVEEGDSNPCEHFDLAVDCILELHFFRRLSISIVLKLTDVQRAIYDENYR